MFDLGMPKPRGEVLVNGSFYSREGQKIPVGRVKVQLGSINKELAVFGDRYWQRPGSSTWSISEPKLINHLPISYKYSFGGENFSMNPLGRGFIEPGKEHTRQTYPLPNIEHIKQLVSSPSDCPQPVGLAPLDLMWPQRASKAGTYDEEWLKTRFPGHPKDLDWTLYNAAPIDQQIKGFFQGDESFQIENMHPQKPLLSSQLPAIRPRCFINQQKGETFLFQEIATRLDTVWLFPGDEYGVIVFRGVHEVSDPDADDVLQQLIAFESIHDEPRPADHYEKTLYARLDKDKGQFQSLNEKPLIPEGEQSGFTEMLKNVDSEPQKSKNILAKNMKTRAERVKKEAKQHFLNLGLNPEEYCAEESPPEEPEFDPENVEDFADQVEIWTANINVEKDRAEEAARNRLKELGFDYDQLSEEAKTQQSRARFSASEKIALLQEFGLNDPEVEKKLYETQEKTDQAYREHGHHFPAVAPLAPDDALQKRQLVQDRLDLGHSLAGLDLTGADLSNMDLQGCNLSNAFLEGVNLSGTDLTKANLSGCVLVRSKLEETKFHSTHMPSANMGYAHCLKAEFRNADMNDCIFYGTKIEKTLFENCTIKKADFSNAEITESDFSDSNISGVQFMESSLSHVSFQGADCSECLFLETEWFHMDFTKANLRAVTCVGVNGDGTNFQNADLRNLRTAAETSFAGANFKKAIMTEATLREINCTDADFSEADLSHADLSKSKLNGAVFYKSIAIGTQFVKADLRNAKMMGINLFEGSLQKTCLHETDLRQSNLYGVDFIQAQFRNTNLSGANRKNAFMEPWITS